MVEYSMRIYIIIVYVVYGYKGMDEYLGIGVYGCDLWAHSLLFRLGDFKSKSANQDDKNYKYFIVFRNLFFILYTWFITYI